MPQQISQTVRTTFVKGLLTEFSELNFPEDASVDELNCSLHKAGNRSRRLGIEIEAGDTPSVSTHTSGAVFHTCQWTTVGGDPSLTHLVVQTGSALKFYEIGNATHSEGELAYTVSLHDFAFHSPSQANLYRIECANINGHFVVVSPGVTPFYITRDNTAGTITTTAIDFKIRDFVFLGDPSIRTEEVASGSVTVAREYDTMNCGWVGDQGAAALTSYDTTNTAYPPLTHPWYSGKNSSGNFDEAEWSKVYSGNTVTVNGHFIIDPFNPDRDGVSGLSGVDFWDGRDAPSLSDSFSTAAAYSGRVFYSGADTKVYFSRQLDDIQEVGDCYQIYDPTSEELSDLLDTDGGWVNIPNASNIQKLHVFGASLFVFAANGVWKISGVDDVFRATEYSVSKVSEYGLNHKDSFISGANSLPFWWSNVGIHTIVVDENGFREVNLSRDTIQSYWAGLNQDFVLSFYDEWNDRVGWMTPKQGETVDNKFNHILFFDMQLQAFYPWEVVDPDANTPHVISAFSPVDTTADDLTFLVRNSTGTLSFAGFTNTDFLDWGTEDYTSYAVSAYNFVSDISRRKGSPYITTLFRQTETAFVSNGSGYDFDRPSSCLISAYWDFKNSSASAPQQGYRLSKTLVVDPSDLSLNYPQSVITTKLKLRGRGRTFNLRFESEAGKDFNLIGWETIDAINPSF